MRNRHLRSGLIALVGAAVGVFLLLLSNGALFPAHAAADVPDEEYQVTCYKWVENGTAHVTCPEKVYAPNSWLNITVKNCSEWRPVYSGEFQRDSPCESYQKSRTNNPQ